MSAISRLKITFGADSANDLAFPREIELLGLSYVDIRYAEGTKKKRVYILEAAIIAAILQPLTHFAEHGLDLMYKEGRISEITVEKNGTVLAKDIDPKNLSDILRKECKVGE